MNKQNNYHASRDINLMNISLQLSNDQDKVHSAAKKEKKSIFLVKNIWISYLVIYCTTNKVIIIQLLEFSYFKEVPWSKSAVFANCRALKVSFSALAHPTLFKS